ncbi:MAG: glycoside hydrolase family 28 protein [Williamsia sp.]|nr:glycoside hydrolase family 28 protein [Williamsia sp.]
MQVNTPIQNKIRYNISLLVCFSLFVNLQQAWAQNGLPDWVNKTGSRSVPTLTKVYKVNQYGAVNDGATLCTAAIQKAIDACSKAGGGIVSFDTGSYVTGSLFVKEGVQLRIDKGVVLLGSQNFDDYPEIDTRIAGIEMKWPAALINVINQKKVSVTGEGTVNARGKFCWDKYWAMRKDYEAKGLRWIVDYDAKRVRTLLVQSSSDVTLKGVTFKNAGFWTVQILYSDHVTADGLIVRNNGDGKGPSTDGIDIDSSSWILVQNCDIDCNDDDFCLKAGRDWDGLRVNRPTEWVVIRKCIARKGGGLLTLGSETSGGIRHVVATGLVGMGTGNGLHIKSATTRGGLIDDIRFDNIRLDSVGTAFQFTMNWNPSYSYSTLPAGYDEKTVPAHWKTMLHPVEPAEKGIPHFQGVTVSNIHATGVKKVINAAGLKDSYLKNFSFNNVLINGAAAGDVAFADGWKFTHVLIQSADGQPLRVTNSTNMQLKQ